MSIASLKDLYLDDLGDLYDAETQMIRALPRFAEAARAPELKEALTRHCEESRLHLERLKLQGLSHLVAQSLASLQDGVPTLPTTMSTSLRKRPPAVFSG